VFDASSSIPPLTREQPNHLYRLMTTLSVNSLTVQPDISVPPILPDSFVLGYRDGLNAGTHALAVEDTV
jgi:hypothetical protein